MEKMDEHKESFLYRDVNDVQSYLIVSEWNDERALNMFINSE